MTHPLTQLNCLLIGLKFISFANSFSKYKLKELNLPHLLPVFANKVF